MREETYSTSRGTLDLQLISEIRTSECMFCRELSFTRSSSLRSMSSFSSRWLLKRCCEASPLLACSFGGGDATLPICADPCLLDSPSFSTIGFAIDLALQRMDGMVRHHAANTSISPLLEQRNASCEIHRKILSCCLYCSTVVLVYRPLMKES